MTINFTQYAVQLWRDPDARPDPETAVALRMNITDRCAKAARQKERYAEALDIMRKEDIPLPYDCRMPELADECLAIERKAWQDFVADLHLREILSIKSAERLDRQLRSERRCGQDDPLPPFTYDNVWAFFEQTVTGLEDMFKEAVVEIFEWLTPGNAYSGLKTNSPFKVGLKVIVGNTARRRYGEGFEIDYSARPRVNALGNVLSMLAGKGVRKHPDDLAASIDRAWGKSETYGDGYLTAKPFANGRCHITFKNAELVDKINQAARDKALRDPGWQENRRGFSH